MVYAHTQTSSNGAQSANLIVLSHIPCDVYVTNGQYSEADFQNYHERLIYLIYPALIYLRVTVDYVFEMRIWHIYYAHN